MTFRRTLSLAMLLWIATAAVAVAANLVGTPGDDSIRGTNHDDTIVALGGDDRVVGLGDDDVIRGGRGDDILYGDGTCPAGAPTADYCDAGETRRDGDDHIAGGKGDDTIVGGGDEDQIRGGDGNDRLEAGSDHDHVWGGDSDDAIFVRDRDRDDVICGRGYDVVKADLHDVVARDCESVRRG